LLQFQSLIADANIPVADTNIPVAGSNVLLHCHCFITSGALQLSAF